MFISKLQLGKETTLTLMFKKNTNFGIEMDLFSKLDWTQTFSQN